MVRRVIEHRSSTHDDPSRRGQIDAGRSIVKYPIIVRVRAADRNNAWRRVARRVKRRNIVIRRRVAGGENVQHARVAKSIDRVLGGLVVTASLRTSAI